ncbi:phospholipid-translocating p-type flippase subfamily protein, partial [Cystoisospora suis]
MGLWRDMCPFLFWGAEWLVSILPSPAAVVRCLPCCAPLARLCGVSHTKGKGADDASTHAVHGTLCVRTHAPHGSYPETPGNTHFHLSKWTNCIRTTEYTWWNFLPKNLWSQISQPANFYFLVMALMQMVPQISDSDGLPTFLFPLSLVMLITAAKDAYENIKRARADQEENDRVCRVIVSRGDDGADVEMVRWRQLRPGDIVKLHCDEPVPADMMMLNCADEYGVAYLETVQLDGETNLKHKMCIPEIAEIVRTDQQASALAIEVSYEPPSAELYKFSGTVTVNPSDAVPYGRHSAIGWGRASIPHLHMSSQRTSPLVTPPGATPRQATTPNIGSTTLSPIPGRSRPHSQSDLYLGAGEGPHSGETPGTGTRGVAGLTAGSESVQARNIKSSDALLALPGSGVKHERGGGGLVSRESSLSRNSQRKTTRTGGLAGSSRGEGGSVPSPASSQFGVDISQFLWRGATLRNTAWAYGVVLYTGPHTRIMKNTRSRELKYSRLQVYYNQHALLLAIAQFVLCLVSAVAFASYNQNMSDTAWYLESSWESGVGNFFVSLGVAFGQYVLLLSYFVPITLLVQLEVCRACQAGFLSADDHMLCPATEKKASVQSVALMEELGSVTHVFSDKTGTLTQNLMQFRCLAVGDTLHGFDEYQEMKSFVSHSSLVSSPAPDRPGSGSLSFYSPDVARQYGRGEEGRTTDGGGGDAVSPNKYVCFNAKLFAQRMRRAPAATQQKAADLLMVMALCHSVLPKQDAQLPPNDPLGGQRMPAADHADDISGHSSSIPPSPTERPSCASPVFSTTKAIPPNRESLFAPVEDLPESHYSLLAGVSDLREDRRSPEGSLLSGQPQQRRSQITEEEGRGNKVSPNYIISFQSGGISDKSQLDRPRTISQRGTDLLEGSDYENESRKCRSPVSEGAVGELKESTSMKDHASENREWRTQGGIGGRGIQSGEETSVSRQATRVEVEDGAGKDTGSSTGMMAAHGDPRILDTSASHRRSPLFSGSLSPAFSPCPSEVAGWVAPQKGGTINGRQGKDDREGSLHEVSLHASSVSLSPPAGPPQCGTEGNKDSPRKGSGDRRSMTGGMWKWNLSGQEEEKFRRDIRFSRAAHHSAGLWEDFKFRQPGGVSPGRTKVREGGWEFVRDDSSSSSDEG